MRKICLILLFGVLSGCQSGKEASLQFDPNKPVYLVDEKGRHQPLEAEAWYLIAANGLQQALLSDSESQCKNAMAQLRDAVCKQGKDLKSSLAG